MPGWLPALLDVYSSGVQVYGVIQPFLFFSLYLEEGNCIQGSGPISLTRAGRLIFTPSKHQNNFIEIHETFCVRLLGGEHPSQYLHPSQYFLSVVTILFQSSRLLSQSQWSLLSCKSAFEFL